MFGICTLFCLILMNVISGTNGVGEEPDNGNGKKDLLFDEMWRMAFEANRHNGKETEKKEMPKEVKEEPKEEAREKEEESTKRVKEEQKEEGENKLWKKVKREPIEDQLKEEEERYGEKWQNPIKKMPKIEEKEWEDLPETEEDSDQQQEEGSSDQSDSDQSIGDDDGKKIEYESKKLQKKKPAESEERKREIIEKFEKMRKKYQMKRENRTKVEREIAKELGTYREKIYEWKRQLNRKKESESKEKKREIIKEFDKMRKEYRNENGNGNRGKFEQKIARELGTCRTKIYKWKKELRGPENLNRKKESESEERKKEIIEKFYKMRKEHQMKEDYKRGDRAKIEQEIAKKLGTHRDKIFGWKREFAKSKPRDKYTNEQKGKIIEFFDKLCEEFANKFNRKAGTQIKDKIARKFGVTRRTIDRWKKNEH